MASDRFHVAEAFKYLSKGELISSEWRFTPIETLRVNHVYPQYFVLP